MLGLGKGLVTILNSQQKEYMDRTDAALCIQKQLAAASLACLALGDGWPSCKDIGTPSGPPMLFVNLHCRQCLLAAQLMQCNSSHLPTGNVQWGSDSSATT